jgi:hypothetical protein
VGRKESRLKEGKMMMMIKVRCTGVSLEARSETGGSRVREIVVIVLGYTDER